MAMKQPVVFPLVYERLGHMKYIIYLFIYFDHVVCLFIHFHKTSTFPDTGDIWLYAQLCYVGLGSTLLVKVR